MIAMNLPQVLNLSIKPVMRSLRVWWLRRTREGALIHIDVAREKSANELKVAAYYQDIEMHARNALRNLGEKV